MSASQQMVAQSLMSLSAQSSNQYNSRNYMTTIQQSRHNHYNAVYTTLVQPMCHIKLTFRHLTWCALLTHVQHHVITNMGVSEPDTDVHIYLALKSLLCRLWLHFHHVVHSYLPVKKSKSFYCHLNHLQLTQYIVK